MSSDESGNQCLKERGATPPHQPTYGVHLSKHEIETLVQDTLKDEVIISIKPLPSGKSFNNRIYFVSLEQRPNANAEACFEIVIKVPGWNFGLNKIQNEVACLLLLEKHCPDIPVPRILAWYEGGDTVRKVQRVDGRAVISDQSRHPPYKHMWILMTRLPGEPLQPEKTDPQLLESIMQDLARHVSQWRRIPAPTPSIGNLRIVSADTGSSLLHGLKIAVQGLLIGPPCSSLPSSQEYYSTKLRGELELLKTNDNYATNREEIVPLSQELLNDILPESALFRCTNTDFIFTHYDLSPRNVLVSSTANTAAGKPTLTLSGIVDFEFAGFFPPEEEFTNTVVNGAGDWPDDVWDVFNGYLKEEGLETPEREVMEQACALIRVIENVAPWQLREGGVRGAELEGALKTSREAVKAGIDVLKGDTEA